MKLNEIYYKLWFLNYVRKYEQIPEIIMKRDHSMRVASYMKKSFQNWNVHDDFLNLSDFIGLYHDIGRFEQWRRYNTYIDEKSIDHANLSIDVIFNPDVAKELLDDRIFDLIIFNSIYHHNKFELPNNLSIKDESIFSKLSSSKDFDDYTSINSLYSMAIRDADKMDILKQYLISDFLLNDSQLPVTEKVANDFLSNRPILKQDRKSPNDSLLLRLAFINDINLTCFLKQIKEENIIEKINEIYPQKNLTKIYFDYAKKRLDELIDNNKDTQYVLKK